MWEGLSKGKGRPDQPRAPLLSGAASDPLRPGTTGAQGLPKTAGKLPCCFGAEAASSSPIFDLSAWSFAFPAWAQQYNLVRLAAAPYERRHS